MFDYLTLGDLAILKVLNDWREISALLPLLLLYLRLHKGGEFVILQQGDRLVSPLEDVISLQQYEQQQQIYGLPDDIGGIRLLVLNREDTIFRRLTTIMERI